jgi:hypothetical protein
MRLSRPQSPRRLLGIQLPYGRATRPSLLPVRVKKTLQ